MKSYHCITLLRAPINDIRRSNLFKKFVEKERKSSENPANQSLNDEKFLIPICEESPKKFSVFRSIDSASNNTLSNKTMPFELHLQEMQDFKISNISASESDRMKGTLKAESYSVTSLLE